MTLGSVSRLPGQEGLAPDVSVVVVTWNSARDIVHCLASVFRETEVSAMRVEAIVVDNDSSDGTAGVVRTRFPQARLVLSGGNLGFARGSNIGLTLARGRFVMLLNPDAAIRPGALRTLATFLDTERDAGLVAPMLVGADGLPSSFAVRDIPKLHHAILRQFGIHALFGGLLPDERHRWRPDNSPVVTPFACGAALMMQRRFLEGIGHLDETLPMYFEDVDLAVRVRRAGRKVYVLPQAQVDHAGAQSSGSSSARLLLFALETGEAPWLYFRRYRGRAAAAAFTVIVLAANLTRCAVLVCLRLLMRREGALRWWHWHWGRTLSLTAWAVSPAQVFKRRIWANFDREPIDARPEPIVRAATGGR
jgi:N-acetylglucosaminyl-diphospho-decaprenol L-rhamnosyltransferase